MRNLIITVPAVVLSCVILAGCHYFPLFGGSPNLAIAGTSWSLEEIVMADGPRRSDQSIWISFSEGGAVSSSSCNDCHGSYAVEGGRISVERLACTRRACPSDVIEIAHYLEATTRFSREGDRLTLFFADVEGRAGEVRFVAREAPQSDY